MRIKPDYNTRKSDRSALDYSKTSLGMSPQVIYPRHVGLNLGNYATQTE